MRLFFFTNFYVLEVGDIRHYIPILLGRSSLKTSRIKIDVHGGTLTIAFDCKVIMFNIFDVIRFCVDANYLCALNVTDELSQDVYKLTHGNELVTMPTKGLDQFVLQLHVIDIPKKLELLDSHTKFFPLAFHT